MSFQIIFDGLKFFKNKFFFTFSFCVLSSDSYSFACESYFSFARVVSDICDMSVDSYGHRHNMVIHDFVGTSVGQVFDN